ARRRYPGLACDKNEFGEPECAGRTDSIQLFLTGDPIRELEISTYLCYLGLESVGGGDPTSIDCPQVTHYLTAPRRGPGRAPSPALSSLGRAGIYKRATSDCTRYTTY